MNEPGKADDPWNAGTFEGCRVAQTRESAERPFIERLRWCCEMSELARKHALAEGRIPPALQADRYR